ncbi:septal ring lytic transglycosylase RlpA family protein [Calidithermus roseus]|uniref:Probable endolytic peptidoglycan transglycosylase RlpA n=1 Tax=Calidithermus roseus TaxID=1644118 RepID=A0A399EZS2_9DEIN|nr:septal ring lytic transglycosylase RlpA family protein [Calidithermus roseus]RIH88539.1 Endolytic peptidoglycan transglycosylase RlpA [Calidithermus roseus]
MKKLVGLLVCLSLTLAQAQEYRVQKGDTLYSIARRHGTTVETLKTLNGLNSDVIKVGQVLRVSGSPSANRDWRFLQQGKAAWYGPGFQGRRTASGERFNTYDLTAAHPTLPFGTRVRVTNLRNGRRVIVRVNDRGPYIRGYVIDLSYAAAQAIGMSGTTTVRLEVLR